MKFVSVSGYNSLSVCIVIAIGLFSGAVCSETLKNPAESGGWQRQLEEYRMRGQRVYEFGSALRRELERDKSISAARLSFLPEVLDDFACHSRNLADNLAARRPPLLDFENDKSAAIQWLAGQVVLLENFRRVREVFDGDRVLSRLLRGYCREKYSGLAELPGLSRTILNSDRVQATAAALRQYRRWRQSTRDGEAGFETAAGAESIFGDWLESSELWSLLIDGRDLREVYSQPRFQWTNSARRVIGSLGYNISRGVGTAIAEVRWRRGHLYGNREIEQELRANLKPLDLLYRKRAYSLTNYVIPGYWVHSAVWLGTESQLREKGLWEHPFLEGFRKPIQEGRSVYDVQYNGLHFVSLHDFMDLDEVAATRVKGIYASGSERAVQIYNRLYEQKEKPYDYSFNLMNPERVVCTEIIFRSYNHVDWPRHARLGRTLLLPDQLAELVFYRDSPLRFIAYYAANQSGRAERRTLADFAQTVGYQPPSRLDGGGNPEEPASPATFVRNQPSRELAFSLEDGGVWFYLRPGRESLPPQYTEPAPVFPEAGEW